MNKHGSRVLSTTEFTLGALIVIGHNIYHAIPNEVPILFALGLLSFRLREGTWTAMGLGRPTSWRRTVVLGGRSHKGHFGRVCCLSVGRVVLATRRRVKHIQLHDRQS